MQFQKMRALLFLSFIGLGLSACDAFKSGSGSDGLSDGSLDVVAPEVDDKIPEAESKDVEVDSIVRFIFTERMDIKSLDGTISIHGEEAFSGVKLFVGEKDEQNNFLAKNERPLTMEYSEQLGVGLDPVTNNKIDVDVTVFNLRHESGRFALNTQYTVVVPEDAQDKADDPDTSDINEANQLGTTSELSFTTEDGEWQAADFIPFVKQDGAGSISVEADQFVPKLASNAKGDVFAIWRQRNTNNTNDVTGIWVSRYLADEESWHLSNLSEDGVVNLQRIDKTELTTSAFEPQITINEQGKAIAIWSQVPDSSTTLSIWHSVFDGSEWGEAEIITGNQSGGDAKSPQVGIDSSGNIIAAWLEHDGTNQRVLTNIYNSANDTWLSSPLTLNSNMAGDALEVSLSVTSEGHAVLVWSQEVSGVFQAYASRYINNNFQWGGAERIDSLTNNSGEFGKISKPVIAIDANNDVFTVWQQHDGARNNIWINRFAGGVWAGAEEFDENNTSASDPFVVFGPDNQAFATWLVEGKVKARSFSLDAGWGVFDEISSGRPASNPQISFDREGNAMAIWVDSSGDVYTNRFSKIATNWAGPKNVENISNKGQSAVLVPLLEDGRILSVWSHFNGEHFSLASALFSD